MTNADDFPEESAAVPAEPNPIAEAFYSRAESRMRRTLPLLVLAGLLLVLASAGWRAALGFAIGCTVGLLNVRWLHRAVLAATNALEGRALKGEPARASTALLAFGLVLRLALVTAVGYAIFKSSLQSFYGYLGGLFMPICAVFAEALYEAWIALRRGL